MGQRQECPHLGDSSMDRILAVGHAAHLAFDLVRSESYWTWRGPRRAASQAISEAFFTLKPGERLGSVDSSLGCVGGGDGAEKEGEMEAGELLQQLLIRDLGPHL